MKTTFKILVIYSLLLLFAMPSALAQDIPDRAKRSAERKANQRVDRKINKGIDDGFDAIEGLFKKKKKKNKDKKQSDDGNPDSKTSDNEAGFNPDMSVEEEIDLWTVSYDFTPGSKILFFDDFEKDEVGEIPRHWKYIKGEIEVVETGDGANIMKWTELTAPNFKEGVTLPDRFTLEFDVYLKGPPYNASYNYSVDFFEANASQRHTTVDVLMGGLSIPGLVEDFIPDSRKEDFYNSWHHISLSFNNGNFKGYFDQFRLFNVRIEKSADRVQFRSCCTTRNSETLFLIDDIKIAEGAHASYDEEIVDGKMVTNNIFFEYDSDVIIPRSYAEIKRIADVINDNPELNFSIEGHSDSEGSDSYNQDLSERRAESVLDALIGMGISKKRLSSKGFGESAPIADNETPEGRATNRRVEFIVL